MNSKRGQLLVGMGKYLLRILILIILFSLVLLTSGCLKKIPYQKEQLDAFFQREENVSLNFITDKGRQVAFYMPPSLKPLKIPKQIIILYPGINSVALDWLGFIQLEDDAETGYLLVDYPGRGFNEGLMHPEENYKNSEGALKALAKYFGVDSVPVEISVMGHSFGAGSALQFALRSNVKHIVLVAPYNTLSKAIAVRSRILAFLTPAEIDNLEQIKIILSRKSPPDITIIHGGKDTVMPVHMGRELASIDPHHIVYHEVVDGNHTNILTTHRDLIFHTLLYGNRHSLSL